MADKEKLMKGLDDLLEKKPSQKRKEDEAGAREAAHRNGVGRPRKGDNRERLSTTNMYTSLSLDKETYGKIRIIAQINNLSIREVMDAALRKYIGLYEAAHGEVVTPRESKISADSLV